MKKLFLLLVLFTIFSCKNSESKANESESNESEKVKNLYARGLNYIDSLDYQNAVAMYDSLSVEYDGIDKSNQLKDSIIASKNLAIEKLKAKKETCLKGVYKDYDPFKKMTWFKPLAEKTEYKNSVYCYFGVDDSGHVNNPRFVIVYYANDWIFWDKANFLIDEKVYTYIPNENPTRDNSSSIWEISDESIDEALMLILNNITEAKVVKYRLEGSSGFDDFELSKSKIKNIKNILELQSAMASLNILENYK